MIGLTEVETGTRRAAVALHEDEDGVRGELPELPGWEVRGATVEEVLGRVERALQTWDGIFEKDPE